MNTIYRFVTLLIILVRRPKFGGWPEETHTQFLILREQYSATMQHRRKLMIDRFKRQLPEISISEIV